MSRFLLPLIFGALDHQSTKALFAVPAALQTELVIGDSVSVVEEGGPFHLPLFAHSWDTASPPFFLYIGPCNDYSFTTSVTLVFLTQIGMFQNPVTLP